MLLETNSKNVVQVKTKGFSRIVGLVDLVSKGYDKVAIHLSITMMTLMVVIVGISVIFRYLFNSPLSWTEEVSGYLFGWVIFLGATSNIYRNDVPAVSVLIERVPKVVGQRLREIGNLLCLAIGGILIWQGIQACMSMWGSYSPALQIHMTYPLLVMPITGIGFFIHYLKFILRQSNDIKSGVVGLTCSLLITVLLVAGINLIPSEWANWMLLVILVIGFLLGIPIAMVLTLAATFMLVATNNELIILPQRLFSGSDNFVLMAIPFFMFTGALMQISGIAQRIVEFSASIVGRFRGGMAFVDLVSSAFFADLSGSPVADTAAIGSVMLPEMIKRGYNRHFAAALQAAAGSMGMLIPPSIATIVYAWVANVSVSSMFLASLLPASLMILSFGIVAYIHAVRHDYPRERAYRPSEIFASFRRASLGLLTPVIIFGGILSGVVTPTEGGVVAAIYTLIISSGVYRSFSFAKLKESLEESVLSTSRVMLILSSAILISWILTIQQIPQALADGMLQLSHNPTILLFILMIILVLIHEVLETSSTLILVVPLILPIFTQLGVSPVHLGILFLINSSLGIITPPVGFLLYIAGSITGSKLEDVTKAIKPFWLAIIIDIILLIFFPHITTIVPELLHLTT